MLSTLFSYLLYLHGFTSRSVIPEVRDKCMVKLVLFLNRFTLITIYVSIIFLYIFIVFFILMFNLNFSHTFLENYTLLMEGSSQGPNNSGSGNGFSNFTGPGGGPNPNKSPILSALNHKFSKNDDLNNVDQ